MANRYCSLFVIFFLFIFKASAQSFVIENTITSFPHVETNVSSSSSTNTAVGMQGTCSTLLCCSTLVYKVILPFDGSLRIDVSNYTPLATSVIGYSSTVPNTTTWSDLTYISEIGNFCGFRDSMLIGRGYDWWGSDGYFDETQNVPAGDYYILFFNENQQTSSGGTPTDITFDFKPVAQGPTASITVDSTVSCNGFSDGGATATVSGGAAPYLYSWSNSATTASITGVTAGTYSVIVTDNDGKSDTATATITQPASLVASAVVDSNTTCNGFSDGGATASATGGIGPYSYSWSNSATTASITGVTAGTYSVTITDNEGCTATSSAIITQPANLVAAAAVDSNSVCGNTNGGATASGTGGTAPYTYSWSNGATTASITGVAAGTYNVTITDNNGCTGSTSVTIATSSNVVVTAVADSNISCNGFSDGGATASATGGTGPYSYSWSNGATTASITGVIAGTYSVLVTDNIGCTDSTTITLLEPGKLIGAGISASHIYEESFTSGQSYCPGDPNYDNWGIFRASLDPDNITYTQVTISGSNLTSEISCDDPVIVQQLAEALKNGTAFSAIHNGNNWGVGNSCITGCAQSGDDVELFMGGSGSCSCGGQNSFRPCIGNSNWGGLGGTTCGSTTQTMKVEFQSSSSTDITHPTCFGGNNGAIGLKPTGGTTPYSYSWSNGDTDSTITGLTAGDYSVILTDANSCETRDTLTITEPDQLVGTIVVDSNATCSGFMDGGLTASAIGGTGSYSYSWFNADTATSITGLSDGVYSVTITDENGCTYVDSAIIAVVDTTAPVVVTQNINIKLDANGNASILASDIDDGSSDACGIATMTLSQEQFKCDQVGVNGVTLTVTDVNGNSASKTATVTVEDVIEPEVFTEDITIAIDANGYATITPEDIDAGSEDACGIVHYSVSPNTFTCEDIGDAGITVVLTVIDEHGNDAVGTAQVRIEDHIAPTVVANNVSIQLDSNGQATLSPQQVDNGSFDACGIAAMDVSQTVFTCENLGPDNLVDFSVRDVNGNVGRTKVIVSVLDEIAPDVFTKSDTVYLGANGLGTLSASSVHAGSTDNCDIASMEVSPSTFSCDDLGFNLAKLTVTDGSGNATLKKASILVVDKIAPTVITKDISVELDNGMVNITPDQVDLGSFDVCGIASMEVSPNSFTCSDVGTNRVMLTVEDHSGNIAQKEAFVHVAGIETEVEIDGLTLEALTANATFQWISCENGFTPIEGATAQSFTATESGSFAVIISQNGCSDTSACYDLRTLSLERNTFQQEIALFPNPTTGKFTIDMNELYQDITVKITNVGGQEISKRIYSNVQVIETEIDGAKGFYFVTISTKNNQSAVFKVLHR